MNVRIHPTAMIEDGCQIGAGTSIWDHVHIRHDTRIGEECIIGGRTIIAYGVSIGNRCKINSNVYLCTAVTIEDGVMISAGVIFTNDRFPRAASPDLKSLRSSEPDESTESTLVCCGATIGAGVIVGSGLTIGRWAMVGMGAIVTKSIPDFHLAIGAPCRSIGAVCRCGQLLAMFSEAQSQSEDYTCRECNRQFHRCGYDIIERESGC
ncbi:MAG: acetyltransferase [Pirellula sp.]|jgi:UDP-3-O-[3-hydroxymyristoyl] glucosamine N-acyltransferase|nr:acetyltransferase [Pirellula sp.]